LGCLRSAVALNGNREATGLVVHVRTPRPTRSRVTVAGGRCPGSRIAASGRLPRSKQTPSGTFDRRLSAYSCGGSRGIVRSRTRTAFPFDPLREPPSSMLPVPRSMVKLRGMRGARSKQSKRGKGRERCGAQALQQRWIDGVVLISQRFEKIDRVLDRVASGRLARVGRARTKHDGAIDSGGLRA